MAYTNSLETHNGRIGKLGEDYACEHLKSIGHTIAERNFRTKYGEIDIISISENTKGIKKIHIVEVKTSQSNSVRPEENMNTKKIRKVAKLGEMYSKNSLFCIDFIGVSLDKNGGLLKITFLENIEIY